MQRFAPVNEVETSSPYVYANSSFGQLSERVRKLVGILSLLKGHMGGM